MISKAKSFRIYHSIMENNKLIQTLVTANTGAQYDLH